MREKSLKWMIGTFIIGVMLIIGISMIVRCAGKDVSTSEAEQVSQVGNGDRNVPEETEIISEHTEDGQTTMNSTGNEDIPDEETLLKRYIDQMPIRDKIGQLVMFGFSGTSTLSRDFKDIVSRYHVGNVVLYGSNIHKSDESGGFDTARKLTGRIESNNPTGIPYLISIDIEGGVVQRFKWNSSPISARKLGKANDYDQAYSQFVRVGKKLKDVGINMNLAPVLDISDDAMNTVLRTRIISGNPEVAANIGSAVVNGLREAECLSTAKHFPGHGGTTLDSHAGTPEIRKSLTEMEDYDLIPFKRAVENGVDTVLVAHIFYPELDEKDIASMSSIIITDLLRGELGHSGLVMSDDFRMRGLTSRYDVGEAAVQFILAGGDLILCGPRIDLQEKIMEGLTNAAESGILTEERLNESVERILKKKQIATGWEPILEVRDAA